MLLSKLEHRFLSFSVEDAVERVLEHRTQMWALMDEDSLRGVMLTSFVSYPSGYKVMVIDHAVMEPGYETTPEEMRFVAEYIEPLAKSEGCHAMRITGRKGWARVLEGYTEVSRTFDKRLAEEN